MSDSIKSPQSVKSSFKTHVDDTVKLAENVSKSDTVKGPVISKTFTNSNLSIRTVNALMARGNKYRMLENMKQKHITEQKVKQLSQGHHNDGCRIKTKVFRNN